jgi:beta-lactamase regulating signal transducer with metallopeptidase domain
MAEFLATLITALGHALLHSLWQVALIGLFAALTLHALRHARSQTRYAVACLALLACVLAPLATLVAQLAATANQPSFAAPRIYAGALPSNASPLFMLAPAMPQIDALLPWIVALWAAGTSVMSLRMAMGLAWIHRLRHTPQPAAQAAWQARMDAMAARFGLRCGIALRLVDTLDSPVSAGWWRPVVMLPIALLNRMPAESIEALLAHELAHIRRHDYLVNLLQNSIEALLFYHPVMWWLSRRIRIEREQIADQLAVAVTGAPRRLAHALSELSELTEAPDHTRTRPALHLAQAAHGGQLMSRIEQLVRPARHVQPGARIVFPILGLAAACIASYAYAQIGKPDPASKPGTYAVQVSRTHDGVARDSFALVRKGGGDIMMWGPEGDRASLEAAKRAMGGEFLWFERAGRAYVVTDPALFERARQAWREADAIGQQMESLGGKMEVHGKRMEALGKRMEQLTPKPELSPATHEAMREMETLAGQQQALAREQQVLAEAQRTTAGRSDPAPNAAAQQQLAQQMQSLAVKQQALAEKQARLHKQQEAVMNVETERLEAQVRPIEALSREMELASKPMEALGKQMEMLGRKHEVAAEQAASELSKLISEALAKDLAKPVPGRTSAQ